MVSYNPVKTLWTASFLYPLRGLFFFLSRPAYWPLFRARLLPIILLSTFIYATLFFWTYLPQVLFLRFQGPGCWFNAAVLVLGEGSAIVALLFEAFFVDETQVDVFDAVLVEHGLSDLVGQTRAVDLDVENAVNSLGKPTTSVIYSPFSLRQIVEFVILLPLNFIPYAGVPLFLMLTGYRAGPFHHWRYFQLLDFTKKERQTFVKQRQLQYTWFGAVALVLQLIPVFSMLFLVTTSAGSALWVVRMERARRSRSFDQSAPGEVYADDPA